MPPEWLISRVCEAFPALSPTAAIRELEEAPAGLIETILELRAYRDAYWALKRANSDDEVDHPMKERVAEVEYELLLRRHPELRRG